MKEETGWGHQILQVFHLCFQQQTIGEPLSPTRVTRRLMSLAHISYPYFQGWNIIYTVQDSPVRVIEHPPQKAKRKSPGACWILTIWWSPTTDTLAVCHSTPGFQDHSINSLLRLRMGSQRQTPSPRQLPKLTVHEPVWKKHNKYSSTFNTVIITSQMVGNTF